MPVDSTDCAPDIDLELCSGTVDHIPEVDLVGQLGESGQESFDWSVWTSSNHVLNLQ